MRSTLRMIATYSIVATTLLAPCAFGDAPSLVGKYREIVHEEKEVSGHFVLGMMSAGQHDSPVQEMTVWIPVETADRLCVSIRSIDGQFEAIGQYDINETEAGSWPISFKPSSTHRRLYKSYRVSELALDARIGDDCNDHEAVSRVLIGWGKPATAKSVFFVVNSGEHSGRIIVPSSDDPNDYHEFECKLIESDRKRVAFHSICAIADVSGLDISQAWFELWRFGEPIDDEILTITYPDAGVSVRQ